MLAVLEAETCERLPLDESASPDALVAHFERLFALLTERPALATLLLGGVRLVVREWRLDGCRWDLAERGRRLVAALTTTINGTTGRMK